MLKPGQFKPTRRNQATSRSDPANKDPAKAAGNARTAASDADAKKDQTRDVMKPDMPKRTGQIAVFISRKDSKLYVRQNFAPLFEVPVTIAPSDRPLGTHIFTADVDKDDSNVLHWSVVTVPHVGSRRHARQRHAARVPPEGQERGLRRSRPSRCRCRTVRPKRSTASPFRPM